MIAKISYLLFFLVATIVAQPCDDIDACFIVVSVDPCLHGSPDCTQAPQCKTTNGGCDIATGCIYTNVPDYPIVTCDDGSVCTEEDTCIGGECLGLPIMCDDVCMVNGMCDLTSGQCIYEGAVQCAPRVCQTGVCDRNVGGCVYTNDDDISCDDGIPCTDDSCMDGVCVSTPVICDEPCMTNGACNPTTGVCSYTPVVCAPMTCMEGNCNPSSGVCEYTPVTNGSPCNDNNICTTESCINGQCQSTPITCTPQPCMTTGPCVPTTGQCSYTPVVCANIPCMTGTCNPSTGQCSYTAIDCNDNNPCTIDSCAAGVCIHRPMNCTRVGSNPCQFNNGTCNPSTGQCVYAVKSNGTTCDDGNLCTTKDKCTSGQCTGTNTCCINRTKNKCGICVSDCCSEYSKVLSFFGLRGQESDVTEVSGGGCSGSTVCCAPTSQSIFTYQSDRCVVRKI